MSLLHLLVPLVAGTQRGGGVINELVAYYTKQWRSWQRGLRSKCGVREGWLAFLETRLYSLVICLSPWLMLWHLVIKELLS